MPGDPVAGAQPASQPRPDIPRTAPREIIHDETNAAEPVQFRQDPYRVRWGQVVQGKRTEDDVKAVIGERHSPRVTLQQANVWVSLDAAGSDIQDVLRLVCSCDVHSSAKWPGPADDIDGDIG